MTTLRDVGNLVEMAEIVCLFSKAKGKPLPEKEFVTRLKKIGEAVQVENNLKSLTEIADLPSDTKLGNQSQPLYDNLSTWWEEIRP